MHCIIQLVELKTSCKLHNLFYKLYFQSTNYIIPHKFYNDL